MLLYANSANGNLGKLFAMYHYESQALKKMNQVMCKSTNLLIYEYMQHDRI